MTGDRYLVLIARQSTPAHLDPRCLAATGLSLARLSDDPMVITAVAPERPRPEGQERLAPPPDRDYALAPGIMLRTDQVGVTLSRDPSGAGRCQWCATPDLIVLASDPDLLRQSGILRPGIDWRGLADLLCMAALPSTRTGLAGCQELLPGQSIRVDRAGDVTVEACWSPWVFARRFDVDDARLAPARLRSVITAAVGAAAARYERILVAVSGGLDSSIVAAALRDSGKDIALVTISTDGRDGDERAYARLLASHLGVALSERRYALDEIDLDKAVSARLARPAARTHEQSYFEQAARVMDQARADVLFTGNGGDAVFCLTQSAVALTDRLLTDGPGRGAARTLLDICALTGAGAASVLRMAAHKLRRSRRRYAWRADLLFLHREVVADRQASLPYHPWLALPPDALPGRAVHIAMLLRVQQALENHRAFRVVHPLTARSILETALGMPTWWWVAGGIDRAVARQAYAVQLPPAILTRRVKGSPDSFAVAVIEHYRRGIAERLLDGHLARERLIDRDAVDQALRRFGPGQQLHHVRLLQLLEVENWVAHWSKG